MTISSLANAMTGINTTARLVSSPKELLLGRVHLPLSSLYVLLVPARALFSLPTHASHRSSQALLRLYASL